MQSMKWLGKKTLFLKFDHCLEICWKIQHHDDFWQNFGSRPRTEEGSLLYSPYIDLTDY